MINCKFKPKAFSILTLTTVFWLPIFAAVFVFNLSNAKTAYAAAGFSCGLGEAHSLESPFETLPGVSLGYEQWKTTWAAVEPQEGELNLTGFEEDLAKAASANKKLFIMLSTSNDNIPINQNIPSWLINQGVETYKDKCGNGTYAQPAIWDLLYREKLGSLITRLGDVYRTDDSVEAIVMMGGGSWGESIITASCAAYQASCTPDVLNPSCDAVQSMASVTPYDASEIASYSNCSGEICNPAGMPCAPTEFGSECYLFDDLYIESVKDMMNRYVQAFSPKPVVFQAGPGMSGTGRTWKKIASWANANYGSRVVLKNNSWSPEGAPYDLGRYNSATGYEPGSPYYFSKDYWRYNKSFSPSQQEQADNAAKLAIYNAVKSIIEDNNACYLFLQNAFFGLSGAENLAGGVVSNDHYFNPDDNTVDCRFSEISNWCPGYLNAALNGADIDPPPPLADPGDIDPPDGDDDRSGTGGPPPLGCNLAPPCYVFSDRVPPSLGCYLECAIPPVWKQIKIILMAIAIILTMVLIFKWVTNMYNPKVLEEMPARAKYLLFFIIIIVGGGSALNIILRFLGFGGFAPWFDVFKEMLDKLKTSGELWF